jgi:hypothetical protein
VEELSVPAAACRLRLMDALITINNCSVATG